MDKKHTPKKKKHIIRNRTYVSILPALLIGAAIVPSNAVPICAVLGALIVVAAVVIAVLLLSKRKKRAATRSAAPAEQQPEAEAEAQQPEPAHEAQQSEPDVQPIAEEQPEVGAEAKEQPEADELPSESPQSEPAEAVPEQPAEAEAEDEISADEQNSEDETPYLSSFEETGEASGRAYNVRRHVFVLVRYDRSYTSRLIQADDKTKCYYDEIKSELMAYKGVKSRISWRHENFRIGRERVAKLQFRGKKLCLYLPLEPSDYLDSKYKIEDFGDVAKNKDVPLAYLIKNDLRSRYAKELIAISMARFGSEKIERETIEFSKDYPYDVLESLIDRKLIKVIMGDQVAEQGDEQVAADSAPAESRTADSLPAEPIRPAEVVREVKAESVKKMISDDRAAHLIEESGRYADRSRTGYVNVDVLSRTFEAGEFVTLDEMKKRINGFDKRMTFVKVLARGVLDKPLVVEAEDFSIDAAKMILLTGGKVIRTKRK